jgi:hypothetical protein
MKVNDEAKIMLLGMAGSCLAAVVGLSWALQGRLTSIEAGVSGIAKLEARADKIESRLEEIAKIQSTQDVKIQFVDQTVRDMKPRLRETQTNVSDLLKEVSSLNPGPVIASPITKGPYGAVN